MNVLDKGKELISVAKITPWSRFDCRSKICSVIRRARATRRANISAKGLRAGGVHVFFCFRSSTFSSISVEEVCRPKDRGSVHVELAADLFFFGVLKEKVSLMVSQAAFFSDVGVWRLDRTEASSVVCGMNTGRPWGGSLMLA